MRYDIKFDIANKPLEWYIEAPKDDENYHKFVLKLGLLANFDWRILDYNAKIIFRRRGGEDHLEFPCSPLRKYINRQDKNIEFFIELSLNNYNKLEALRMGGHLEAKLSIDEMFLIPFIQSKERRETSQSATEIVPDLYLMQYPGPISSINVKYNTAKLVDCELFILQDDWVEKVIKPLDMGERFVVEIPCKLPQIPEKILDKSDLQDLKEKLEKGIRQLKSAIDEYNKGKDAKKCITNVREVSDHLYEIPKNRCYKIEFKCGKDNDMERLRIYSEYLIEKTGTGSKEISPEIMQSIQIIIDQIFDIASKVPHGRTRKREDFDYEPSYEDAEMMLGIISLICYWMSIKFEKSMTEL